MKIMNVITSFTGDYAFLSNFWPSSVVLDGLVYPTVEHAYQTAKTLDPAARATILNAATPGIAKRLGGYLVLRDDWGDIKLGLMEELVWQKFQIIKNRQRLLETGDSILIEGNTWKDTFWGVCHNIGANHLGKILMKTRDGLR